MNKIEVRSCVNPEIYQQLQQYMTETGVSEIIAIEAILTSYFADSSQNELIKRLTKIEEDMSFLKRHVVAIRFR